ncbi:unnamed protein product [Ambrosiozyma monospora]|uniref:Unnamed protein product n=1 Tax=Ambrosiozyma monospora TaxID=43982 RepID=A0ACB5U6R2_AMBMO|nr:unnamed protein product [Ambrosiozyma monospora]
MSSTSNNFPMSTFLDLPPEIRSLICKYTARSMLEFDSVMHELFFTSNNPILDDFLPDIVRHLVLNETVFESQCFDKFVDYVLSKKIKVRSVTIPKDFDVTDEQSKLLDFFKLGTQELRTTFTETTRKMAYAEFITFLNGSIGDTYPEFMFTCLKSINEFTNLVCLRLELRESWFKRWLYQ